MIEREIASPTPIPSDFVAVEWLEHVLGGLASSPLPVSFTSTTTSDPWSTREPTDTSRWPSQADQGFQSVLDQVQDDLLDLDAVGEHRRQVLRQSRVERNVLLVCFAPHQRDDSGERSRSGRGALFAVRSS